MKILLIRPEPFGLFSLTRQVQHEPLELEYLYTAFRQDGHNPVIYDRHCDYTPLKRRLRQARPGMVCITGYITQEPVMKRLAAAIKALDPAIRVVLGGSHVELNYKNFYDSAADYLCHISGLGPLRELAGRIASKNEDATDLPGLCYRKGRKWVYNEKVTCDPAELPVPDRSCFLARKNRYRYLTFRPLALVKGAYSCPYRCSFCYCTNMNGGAYRARSASALVEEIAAIPSPNVHIVDDDFLVDGAFLAEFIRLMREKRVEKKLLVYGRADFIAGNPDLMAELASVGLSLVMVGLEAVEDSELKSYDKGAALQHNVDCVKVMEELGIYCAGLFIVHQDMERRDFDRLYDWISARKKNLTATVSILTPMQGSREYERVKGQLLDTSPGKQDLAHCILPPTKMSLKRFYYEYYRLSLRLAWATRKHPVYKSLGPADIAYLLAAPFKKLWRTVTI